MIFDAIYTFVMKVLGIDQSYRSCGIVVLEDGNLIHREKYTTDDSKDIYERAKELACHLVKTAHTFSPDAIALEGLSYGSTGNVTRDLGGLLFLIIVKLREHSFRPFVIAPPTIKKVATGKGNAKKEKLIEALPPNIRASFDELGVKKTTGLSDLSDAYWVAQSAVKILTEGKK